MNCKPGDLAVIVGMPPALAEARDKVVRLANEAPEFLNGEPIWRLTKRVGVVLVDNARRNGVKFYIGESVWFDRLQDKYLRPIRDPGDDARDEMLRPLPEEVPA